VRQSDHPSSRRATATDTSVASVEDSGALNVLLVDDDLDFVSLASTLLETENDRIETSTETNPKTVLREVDLEEVDCIVSDYRMPEMDGIELLEAIRKDHRRLPFILFTGQGSETVAREAMAAGVSDYIVKNGSPEQYAISAHRIENLVSQHRTQKQMARGRTLERLQQAVVRTVLCEPTREKIQQDVCEHLVDTALFSTAWIGERDPHSEAIRPCVWAGDKAVRQAVSFSADRDPQTVEEQALADGTSQIETDLAARSEKSQWAKAAVDHGTQAAFGVPISYEGIPYGVLGIYTDRRDGFGADEANRLEMLADLTGFAIGASERRGGDTSRQVVDITFDVSSTELPFVRIAEALGCAVSLSQTLHQSNGTALTRYRIADVSADQIDDLDALSDAESVQVFERVDALELAIVSTKPWWEELAGLYGARVSDATADAEGASLRLELPSTATVRTVVDLVSERVPGATAVSRHERIRSDRSLGELEAQLGERLTDRQQEVIETAYHAGYFEWPHATSSESVAELLGITQPTFAEHFWTAQRRIIRLLLDSDKTDERIH